MAHTTEAVIGAHSGSGAHRYSGGDMEAIPCPYAGGFLYVLNAGCALPRTL